MIMPRTAPCPRRAPLRRDPGRGPRRSVLDLSGRLDQLDQLDQPDQLGQLGQLAVQVSVGAVLVPE
jgi:hypothetical protein